MQRLHQASIRLVGLMELKLKGDTDVEAFQPGHYEEYEIDTEGKVWLLRREQYRSIGDVPNFLTIKPAPTGEDSISYCF